MSRKNDYSCKIEKKNRKVGRQCKRWMKQILEITGMIWKLVEELEIMAAEKLGG